MDRKTTDRIAEARKEAAGRLALADANKRLEEAVQLTDVCSMYSFPQRARDPSKVGAAAEPPPAEAWRSYTKSSDAQSFLFELLEEPASVQLERARRNPEWKDCNGEYTECWSKSLILPLAELIRGFPDRLGLGDFVPEGPSAELMHDLFFDLTAGDLAEPQFIDQLSAIRIEMDEGRFDLQTYFEQLWKYFRRRYSPSASQSFPQSLEAATAGGWLTTKQKAAVMLGVTGTDWCKRIRADRDLPAPVVRAPKGGGQRHQRAARSCLCSRPGSRPPPHGLRGQYDQVVGVTILIRDMTRSWRGKIGLDGNPFVRVTRSPALTRDRGTIPTW